MSKQPLLEQQIKDHFAREWANAGKRSREEALLIAARNELERLRLLQEPPWQPIETAPKDGDCLLAIETDDGYVFSELPRDKQGNWIHEGEPTFCHGYYFHPTHWKPKPRPPEK